MTQPELQNLCTQACKIVGEVAGFIRDQTGQVAVKEIEVKSLNSLVSYVDKTAEERLVSRLSELLPNSTFLTEEETIAPQEGEYQWIIDPLDGTTNFLHQLPFFAVSVALRQNETIVLGIVYEVNRQECFSAWKGGGAFLNGKKIGVSKTTLLADSLISTGFPYWDYDRMAPYLVVFQHFMKNTRGIRRFGAAAADLAYVACGRFDMFFEYSLNAWDVAAGILLVEEAGGKVSDFRGGPDHLFGGEILAASPAIFDESLKVIRSAFSDNEKGS